MSLFSATSLNVTTDSEGKTFTMAGIDLGVSVYTTAGSGISTIATGVAALTNVKAAITQLSSERATIGAYQSRLNYTAEQVDGEQRENLTAASSRIQDVDVAEESTQ